MVCIGHCSLLNLMSKIADKTDPDLLETAANQINEFIKKNSIHGIDFDLEWWHTKKDGSARKKEEGPHPAGIALAKIV
jgi:hypothetical protein